MARPSWAPEHNLDRPSAARIRDYLLGGGHNFESDRALARQVLQLTGTAHKDGATTL